VPASICLKISSSGAGYFANWSGKSAVNYGDITAKTADFVKSPPDRQIPQRFFPKCFVKELGPICRFCSVKARGLGIKVNG
jgi:hypothetical protein